MNCLLFTKDQNKQQQLFVTCLYIDGQIKIRSHIFPNLSFDANFRGVATLGSSMHVHA